MSEGHPPPPLLCLISNPQVRVHTWCISPLSGSLGYLRKYDPNVSVRSSSHMTTCSGMLNHLSHLEEMYIVLLLHGSFVMPDNTIYTGQTPGSSWMGITEIGTLLLLTMIGSQIANMIIAKQSGSSPRKMGQERWMWDCARNPPSMVFAGGEVDTGWWAGIKDCHSATSCNRSVDTILHCNDANI